MRRSQVYARGPAEMGFNVTPMIDMTFLLIVFFLLAGTFASADNLRLEVPAPHESVAAELDRPSVVVNVAPYSEAEVAAEPARRGQAKLWQVRGRRLRAGDGAGLAEQLRQARTASGAGEAFEVEIRADRSLHYGQVRPVMAAARQAGIRTMNLTAREP